MKKVNKILSILLVIIMLLSIRVSVWAEEPEVVTLDLANGNIDITPTGYSQNDEPEVSYTGAYIITGRMRSDSPLDIINESGSEVTFNITLDSAKIIANTWCTAVRINGDSPIVLNIINSGISEIEAHNHSAIKYIGSANVAVNITIPSGSTLEMRRRDRVTPYVFESYPGTDLISMKVNGMTPDNAQDYCQTHICSYSSLWTPDVTQMTKEEYDENKKEIELQLVCGCGDIKARTTSFVKNCEYPNCTRNTTGYYIANVDGNDYWSPHIL